MYHQSHITVVRARQIVVMALILHINARISGLKIYQICSDKAAFDREQLGTGGWIGPVDSGLARSAHTLPRGKGGGRDRGGVRHSGRQTAEAVIIYHMGSQHK